MTITFTNERIHSHDQIATTTMNEATSKATNNSYGYQCLMHQHEQHS